MEYRTIKKTGQKVSVIGMGASSIAESSHEEMVSAIRHAIDHGINYFDLAAGSAKAYAAYGEAFAGNRDKVLIQVHFGADYRTGEYGRSTNLDVVRASVEWQLEQLHTDRIDFGFIHCIDEQRDLKEYINNGVLDYIMDLKKKGIVRQIGLSTHHVDLANKVLDMGILDVLMFSINPAYDYDRGEYSDGGAKKRMELYRRCEKEGVGITVMKAFGGGKLLSDDLSLFKKALTRMQCIAYALDKPGVVTVLPGCRSVQDVKDVLAYLDADEKERDYSMISRFTPESFAGTCVYCSHCMPCPVGIDIALVNKYYDLARLGDSLAREHYLSFEKNASDCIGCAHCDKRCPFHVDQSARIKEIRAYFDEKQ